MLTISKMMTDGAIPMTMYNKVSSHLCLKTHTLDTYILYMDNIQGPTAL